MKFRTAMITHTYGDLFPPIVFCLKQEFKTKQKLKQLWPENHWKSVKFC